MNFGLDGHWAENRRMAAIACCAVFAKAITEIAYIELIAHGAKPHYALNGDCQAIVRRMSRN